MALERTEKRRRMRAIGERARLTEIGWDKDLVFEVVDEPVPEKGSWVRHKQFGLCLVEGARQGPPQEQEPRQHDERGHQQVARHQLGGQRNPHRRKLGDRGG